MPRKDIVSRSHRRLYRWKKAAMADRYLSGLDAQACGEAIDRLAHRLGRGVEPDDIVEAGRNGREPLFREYLEWDNAHAGEQFRLQQARKLIGSITYEPIGGIEGHDVPAFRAFVHYRGDDDKPRGYYPSAELISEADSRAIMVDQARRYLLVFQERFGMLMEFATSIDAINKDLARLEEERREKPQRPQTTEIHAE